MTRSSSGCAKTATTGRLTWDCANSGETMASATATSICVGTRILYSVALNGDARDHTLPQDVEARDALSISFDFRSGVRPPG